MKKALLFIAAAIASGSAFAQIKPSLAAEDVTAYAEANAAIIKTEFSTKWIAKNILDVARTNSLTGIIGAASPAKVPTDPTATADDIKWDLGGAPGQYTLSYVDDILQVAFDNKMLDEKGKKNYKDFSLGWTGVKQAVDADGKENALTPFDEKGDTLFGQFVNLEKGKYSISIEAKSDVALSLRVDLVDANGRVGNNGDGSVYGAVTTDDYTKITFTWNNTTPDANGGKGGIPEDHYNGSFLGTDNGRYNGTETTKYAPFYGLNGVATAGWAPLDMTRIAKVAFTIDDADKGKLGDKKTLLIKSLTIGNGIPATKLVARTFPAKPSVGLKGIAKKSIKAYAVGNAIKVEGKAKVYNTHGQIVAEGAESIEVPSKGIYRVVSTKGAKTVVVD